MLAITFCGLTFPIFGMPIAAQVFAAVFPFTYWIQILMGQSLRGEPIANSILSMYSLLAFVLFGMLFISKLMHAMHSRKRWGNM
jgi:ABC-2 type transport system permease protein